MSWNFAYLISWPISSPRNSVWVNLLDLLFSHVKWWKNVNNSGFFLTPYRLIKHLKISYLSVFGKFGLSFWKIDSVSAILELSFSKIFSVFEKFVGVFDKIGLKHNIFPWFWDILTKNALKQRNIDNFRQNIAENGVLKMRDEISKI